MMFSISQTFRPKGFSKAENQGNAPPEFTRGTETGGAEHLVEFVEKGGVLVTMDASSELAIRHFGLPVINILDGAKPDELFCPGSILQIEVNPEQLWVTD
jgi:hypothetical protein